MTPSQLKEQYQLKQPNGHFFDRDTMRYWGDTMKNFGVYDGGDHWVLYRKRAVKYSTGGGRKAWHFDKQSLNVIQCVEL